MQKIKTNQNQKNSEAFKISQEKKAYQPCKSESAKRHSAKNKEINQKACVRQSDEEFRIRLKRQRKNSTNLYLAVYLNFAKIRADNSIDSERFSYSLQIKQYSLNTWKKISLY